LKEHRLSITVIAIALLFAILPGLAWAKEETVKEVVSQEVPTEVVEPQAVPTEVVEPQAVLPEEPVAPVVKSVALPTNEFWDKMAWCETHQNWQDGGQWAGGLGIYTKGEFFSENMGTWERWGGEEFAVLLPNTTALVARDICERIREAIMLADCSAVAPGLNLTISMGIAEFAGETQYEKLLSRSDSALYQAKKHGRNRIDIALPV
jgi:hypothetical protein